MNVFIYGISQRDSKKRKTKKGKERKKEKRRKEGKREKMISLLNCLKEGTNKKEALFSKILKLKTRSPRTQGISFSPNIRKVWQREKMPFGSSSVWEEAGEGR